MPWDGKVLTRKELLTRAVDPAAPDGGPRPGRRRQAQRQVFEHAHREIGESLRFEGIAAMAERHVDALDRRAELLPEHVHKGAVVPAAAGHKPVKSRAPEMPGASRDRGHRHRRERRCPVLGREVVWDGGGEIVAVERFGRPAREVRMRQEMRQMRLADLALAGKDAVLIVGFTGVAQHPVVDERVARPGVESEDVIIAAADPGHVGDAADIEDGDGPRERADERAVKERRERRALAAGRDIVAAEIVYHVDAGERGEQRAIADLPGAALARTMQDRVAVKPDQIDIADRVLLPQRIDRRGMEVRELALDARDIARTAEHAAEPFAELGRIRHGQERPGLDLIAPVGPDEGGVDSIERRATHQTDDAVDARRIHALIRRPDMAPASFLTAAEERGFLHQITDRDGLEARLRAGPVTAYIGFDCTADSLHVGHLLQIMLLRLWQQTGNRPIVLMGGGTTKIGDPSGKDESRQLLSGETIAANMASIRRVFDRFLKFGDGPSDAIMSNNALWLDELRYIPLLRDYGRHFSVNRMLTQDSVRLRLEREQPLSFLEFNYMVLQAYDFVELARRHDCAVQMGGSDQWGNIVMGVELGRRAAGFELFGITSPLLTTASGAKMGKTAAGAVWLNTERMAPYDYWQYWRNTEDADVGRLLRLLTELPLGEIARLERLQDSEINDAKIVLATEATALCHGRDAALAAAETARRVFAEGGIGGDLPVVDLPRAELEAGAPAIQLFLRAGLAASLGEARRLMRGGGARINDETVTDEARRLTPADIQSGVIKLSAGRKRHALVRVA
jgi:tyrosyl-tRNA synthetase